MGEIADDMVCGFQCSGCGVCFENEHGYPVLCGSCYKDWYIDDPKGKRTPKEERLPQATEKEL